MTLPQRIRTLRQVMGLSREEFGALYAASSRTVEAWEQGLRTPSHFIRRDLEKRFKKLNLPP